MFRFIIIDNTNISPVSTEIDEPLLGGAELKFSWKGIKSGTVSLMEI